MSTPIKTLGKAELSCQRCHRRKKRCDKLLPECNGCREAAVPCSFLQDSLQEASFSIEYVRGLERRVYELEQQLAETTGLMASSSASIQSPSRRGAAVCEDQLLEDPLPDTPPLDLPPTSSLNPTPRKRSTSLADGLKMLSLEATAERYVGSSSGIAFAELTQTVLRRLSPDQEAFVFENDEKPDNQDLKPTLADSLDPDQTLLDLDMILDSPQQITSMPIDPLLHGGDSLLEFSDLDAAHISSLLDFYFAHSHTLYPIIQQQTFIQTLWASYGGPLSISVQSPLTAFRIWMVLAIGSTTYCSVTLMDETESIRLFNKAMSYFEAAMGCGELAALEVLMLQVSYSFFNSAGPNTWFLVGVAARMAIGMGLHTREVYESLTPELAEYQKRLFFSLYMMDRVVSMALGRPFAIQDDDITVEPFADANDENITSDGIIPARGLGPSSMAVPLHILSLRKIASEIGTKIHSNKPSQNTAELRPTTTENIHKCLIQWRRNMPFPLPDSKSKVPHLCTSWFDLNYYTHLIMLYRPSSLAGGDINVDILSEASGMAIREANNLYRQQRFAFNWLNLMTVFNASLTLIYSTTARDVPFVIERTRAIEDLELAMNILEQFCRKFPSAVQIMNMVRTELVHLRGSVN